MKAVVLIAVLLAIIPAVATSGESTAHYLGNEGVMVEHGDIKILFDPLFRESYGQYERVPPAIEQALFEGQAPYDGIDAVLVSHYHGDHFSPELMLEFLRARPAIHLYAPAQAVDALRDAARDEDESLFERVTAIDRKLPDLPEILNADGLLIEATHIPHSGWPTRRLDVQNLAFRVTLDDAVTVVHLGDADPNDAHFARHEQHWSSRTTDMAFPPYWFFHSNYGPEVLRNRLNGAHAVGIHVPETMPDERAQRPDEWREFDLFTRPGETRRVDTRAADHPE